MSESSSPELSQTSADMIPAAEVKKGGKHRAKPIHRRAAVSLSNVVEFGKASVARLVTSSQANDIGSSAASTDMRETLATLKSDELYKSPVLAQLLEDHYKLDAAAKTQELQKAKDELRIVGLSGPDYIDVNDAYNQYGAKEPIFLLFTVGDEKEETWGVFKNHTDGQEEYVLKMARLVPNKEDDGKTQRFDWASEKRLYNNNVPMDLWHEENYNHRTQVRLTVTEEGKKFQLAPDGTSTLSVLAHPDSYLDTSHKLQPATT